MKRSLKVTILASQHVCIHTFKKNKSLLKIYFVELAVSSLEIQFVWAL